ncbi:MAG: dihydroorotate dehydrogenase [Defluviitaleaceae bacterium]|nr:dihydroorotate dehydrogenase [Defluviitaleaceae bacterium]
MSLNVSLSGIEWKNPVTTASGTFGTAKEMSGLYDISRLGAITVKGVAPMAWSGNPPPRIGETYGGMLNAVGLQNGGIDSFVNDELPDLLAVGTNIIVNVCGRTMEDYVAVIERLSTEKVDMLELNISCPNVSKGGIAFGTNSELTFELVKMCKQAARQPLYVKLSPNVTDIAEIATAAEAAGADGITLINTLLGMSIDIKRKKPLLGNVFGGLSGPAIMPVALRSVYQVYKKVSIPIIGMGGISSAEDAVMFLMAGASAVAVGTANLIKPGIVLDIIDGIEDYVKENGLKSITDIVGIAH